MDKLKEYFRIEDIKFKVPLPDCTTRWNYTFYMIDWALEIKPFLANLKSNLKTLTDNWPTDEEVYPSCNTLYNTAEVVAEEGFNCTHVEFLMRSKREPCGMELTVQVPLGNGNKRRPKL